MMENVSMFDVISIALILILGIKGIINGFIKEVFGLIGIIGGIYFASRYAPEAGGLINDHVYHFSNQASMYLFGFIGVLVVFWVSSIFLGYIIAQALRISGLSAIDKLAGFAVGSMKIFFVFSIFTVTLNNIEFIKERIEPYAQKSIMFPIFTEAGHYIVKLDTKQMLESAKEPFDTKNP